MIDINKEAPQLVLTSTEGKEFDLQRADPDKMTLVVFYRGKHCPVCKDYLKEMEQQADDYRELGVDKIVAVSGDNETTAKETHEEWGISKFPILYDLSTDTMKEWGLFISTAIKDKEPKIFNEPGYFLINPDNKVFYAGINSMPFGRPDISAMKKSIQYIFENEYPSRGRGI